MAVIKRGILGGLSGSIGSVVGSSWKGIAVLKSKPLSVANPKTAAQTAQRTKFKNVGAFASLILASVIKPLWDRFAQGQSGYNAFVAENIELFSNSLPSPAADLVISQGKMAATEIGLYAPPAGTVNVQVNWTDDSGTGLKQATDIAYIVVVNETQGEVAVSDGSATRADETETVALPSQMATNDQISTYLAFKRADGTVVSNTAFKTGVASA